LSLSTLTGGLVLLGSMYLALEPFPHKTPCGPPWLASPAPLTGLWGANDVLGRSGVFLARGHLTSETAFPRDPNNCDGSMHATDLRGRVWLLPHPDAGADAAPTLVKHVGGSLLGAAFASDGTMYLADATRGLISVAPEPGAPIVIASVLAPSSAKDIIADDAVLDEAEVRYANDVAVCAITGNVYFTSASMISPTVTSHRRARTFDGFSNSVLSGDASGRVLAFVPSTGDTHILATGIPFANGIAVSPDGSTIVVASSNTYSLLKVAVPPQLLSRPSVDDYNVSVSILPVTAIDLERFFDGELGGIPDGVTADPRNGHVWVTLFAPTPPIMRLVTSSPWVTTTMRRMLAALPHQMRPSSKSVHAYFAEFSPDGTLLRTIHDQHRKFGLLTSVVICGRHIYSGALTGRHVSRFNLYSEGEDGLTYDPDVLLAPVYSGRNTSVS
jgi:Strictosidine synthase